MITHTKKARPYSVTTTSNQSSLLTTVAKSIEALWLTTLFLVPILFGPPETMAFVDVPKVALLRALVGGMVGLWALEWAIKRNSPPSQASLTKISTVSVIVLAAALMFMLSVAVSALFSVDREISLWGRNPGRDGYYLYNIFSYILMFAVIAFHIKKIEQIWRSFGAVIASSLVVSVYGIFQHYSIDPFNQIFEDRILSTFGNPIFASSYLIMSTVVTLVFALARSDKASRKETAGWILALSIQFIAMVFTLSRGPWLGMAAAIVFFLMLSSLFLTRRLLLKSFVLVGAAGAIAFFVSVPMQYLIPAGDPVSAENGALQRAASLYDEIGGAGLSGRVDIWRHSASVSMERPPLSAEDESSKVIRHAFGYGPDMFLYALPLKRGDDSPTAFTATAHNYWINLWVENGLIGVAAFSAFVLALAAACFHFILKGRKDRSGEALDVIATGVLAIIAGRSIEQMVGIARVSDLSLFWALAAVVVVLPLLKAQLKAAFQPPDKKTSSLKSGIGWKSYTRYAIAGSIGVLAVGMAWSSNLNYVRAAFLGTSADAAFKAGDTELGFEKIGKAISLAPAVEEFYEVKGLMLGSVTPANDKEAESIALERYAVAKQAVGSRPRSFTTQASAAEASLALFRLGYAEKGDESTDLYARLAYSLPTHEPPTNWLAQAYLVTGRPAAALQAIENFRAANGMRPKSAQSLYLEGLAYEQTGDRAKAVYILGESMKATKDPNLLRAISARLDLLRKD